jgi:hypothetical protein
MSRDRYAQCDGTCTVDCGACKGAGRPSSNPGCNHASGRCADPAHQGLGGEADREWFAARRKATR